MGSQKRYPSLVGPMILIGIGAVLLLQNLGMLQWSIWEAVLTLWPLLLVAAGLDLLLGRRSLVGNLLVALIVLAMLAGGLWWMSGDRGFGAPPSGREISQPLAEASSAQVAIQLGAAGVRVAGGAAADRLVTGVVSADGGAETTSDARVENGVLMYKLRSLAGSARIGPWSQGGNTDLSVNSQVPMSLGLNLGAGDITIDLSGTQVHEVTVQLGAGRTTLTLPRSGSVSAALRTGTGEVVVRVPRGRAVKVDVTTAVGTSRTPGAGQRFGRSQYASPGFEAASERLEVQVSCAVGSVVVEEY